jgi:hypothetical protein
MMKAVTKSNNNMKQTSILILFILFTLNSFAQQKPPVADLPPTEIYLLNIQQKGNTFSLTDSTITNISNNKGYDNQPYFIDKLNSIAYVSSRNNKPTDIYLYNLKTAKTKQLTNNNEAEYSPKLTPDGKYISVVKGAEQNLTRISLRDTTSEKLYTSKDSIGYYCWLNNDEIAAVVLTKPISLKLINIKTKTEKYLADSIGRSLFFHANGIVTCITLHKESRVVFVDTNGNLTPLIVLPQITEDFYITADGWLFTSNGSSIVYCNSKELDKGWRVLADLRDKGISKIYRLAVNGARTKLAFVTEEK